MIEDAPLKEVDILKPLPPEELERLALLSYSMHLEPGEVFTLDEDRQRLLLLASGRVRVHEPSTTGGPDLTFSMIEEGTVAGQTGFASRLSQALRVEALQPSIMLVLRWEDFEELVLRNPGVAIKTIRLLSERLAVCEGRLSDLIRKEVPARLATLIRDRDLLLESYAALAPEAIGALSPRNAARSTLYLISPSAKGSTEVCT